MQEKSVNFDSVGVQLRIQSFPHDRRTGEYTYTRVLLFHHDASLSVDSPKPQNLLYTTLPDDLQASTANLRDIVGDRQQMEI